MVYLPLILLILAAIFSGATIIAVVFALRSSREHRNTIFPIVREVEGIKARRAGLAAAALLVFTGLSIGGWAATQQNPKNILAAREATDQALAQPPTPQPTGQAAQTVAPTLEPTAAIATTLPTATPQIIGSTLIVTPTATPSPTPLPTAAETPPRQPSPVTAPPGITFGPVAFASAITGNREAVDPATVFNRQADKIYAVFAYSGMKNGLPFSVVWYHQNQEIIRDEYEWEWGTTDHSYVFINPVGTGNYNVEFKIGTSVVATGTFEITP